MSGAVTRVFIARLSGIAVFDPRGDQVGKVRDIVVTLRSGNQAPRVLGLVVEVMPRRRIFCPMTRVTNIDSGAVVTTGLLNMRRFEQRAGETLVMSELFDKRVTLLETGEQVTVQDVAIQQERTRDWIVSRIFVRKGGHTGFRRRGETVVCVFSMQARVGGRGQAALGSACTPSHLHDLSCYDLSCCGAVLDPRHVRLRSGLGQPGEHDDPGDPHGRVWPVWSDLQQHVAGHHLAPVVRCAQQGRGTLMRAASLTCRNC